MARIIVNNTDFCKYKITNLENLVIYSSAVYSSKCYEKLSNEVFNKAGKFRNRILKIKRDWPENIDSMNEVSFSATRLINSIFNQQGRSIIFPTKKLYDIYVEHDIEYFFNFPLQNVPILLDIFIKESEIDYIAQVYFKTMSWISSKNGILLEKHFEVELEWDTLDKLEPKLVNLNELNYQLELNAYMAWKAKNNIHTWSDFEKNYALGTETLLKWDKEAKTILDFQKQIIRKINLEFKKAFGRNYPKTEKEFIGFLKSLTKE